MKLKAIKVKMNHGKKIKKVILDIKTKHIKDITITIIQITFFHTIKNIAKIINHISLLIPIINILTQKIIILKKK